MTPFLKSFFSVLVVSNIHFCRNVKIQFYKIGRFFAQSVFFRNETE